MDREGSKTRRRDVGSVRLQPDRTSCYARRVRPDRAPAVLTAVLALSVAGCAAQQCGWPRFPVSVASPDGRHVAFVQNHPDIDPPNQSIWVQTGNNSKQIQQLGPDSDWCDTIVWSADSSTVSYLIQNARLITVDAASQRIVSDQWLTAQDSYPPLRMVINLSINMDGSEARFQSCWRNMNRTDRHYYVHDPFNCGELQSVRLIPNP